MSYCSLSSYFVYISNGLINPCGAVIGNGTQKKNNCGEQNVGPIDATFRHMLSIEINSQADV